MLKKTTLAILGLAISGLASAGTMGPVCAPGAVTVPCEATLWDLGVQALYLQPIYGKGHYIAERVGTTSNYRFNQIEPDWDLGYRLEGSYHFNTGNDITINWSHLKHDNWTGYHPSSYLLTGRTFSSVARTYVENRYDQVNLVFGQHVDMGLLKNARFYGGMQYVDIRADHTSRHNVSTAVQTATGGISSLINRDFTGFGPVVGVDYDYDLSQGFSITANASTSLLYGTSRLNVSDVYGNGLVAANTYASRKGMVVGFEGKLGLNYGYSMAQGVLNIQVGYQATDYVNALQAVELSGLSYLANSDMGYYGPYLGLKWVG